MVHAIPFHLQNGIAIPKGPGLFYFKLLWENANADIPGCDPHDEGKDDWVRGDGIKHSEKMIILR
jgi:hypothetical protein